MTGTLFSSSAIRVRRTIAAAAAVHLYLKARLVVRPTDLIAITPQKTHTSISVIARIITDRVDGPTGWTRRWTIIISVKAI